MNPTLCHYPPWISGLRAALQLLHGRHAYPTVKIMSSASWLHCSVYLLHPQTLDCTVSLPWQEFVEGLDFKLTTWPVSGFWFVPPRTCCRDILKGYLLLLQFNFHHRVSRAWFSCFALWWQFELHRPLLAWLLLHLLLVAASSGLCMRLSHLCHRRNEGLALCLTGGGATVSRWLHYLRFQVWKIIFK